MTTKSETQDQISLTLAMCYQFQRDHLMQIRESADYVLPKCWGRSNPVWRRLSNFTQNQGIDPVRYIRWSLHCCQTLLNPPPEPNQLLHLNAMIAYNKSRKKVREIIKLQLKMEMERARTEIGVRQRSYEPLISYLYALMDDTLSPLFRFIIARRIGGERMMIIAKNNEVNALFQFSEHPVEYQAIYGKGGCLPEGFAEQAGRLYNELIKNYAAMVGGPL
jgi:hypothetical protein